MKLISNSQGSFINLTCVAISLPGLPIDVDWFHKNKVVWDDDDHHHHVSSHNDDDVGDDDDNDGDSDDDDD